jgi:Putative adhesin
MNKLIHSSFVTLTILATTCSIAAYARAAEGSFDRTLNVSGTVYLEVSTGSGSIDIRRGTSDRVEIHGRIRAGDSWSWWRSSSRDAEDVVRKLEANPPIEQSGQTIRVGRISDRDGYQNVSISYEVVVPAQSNVRSSTGSGRLTVEGIEGKVEASTGSGSVTLRDIKGDVNATAGSGAINATGIRGALRTNTGSGGIHVQGEQTGRWELEAGSGSIEIDLPPNAAFNLSAHTGSGGVDVAYPVTVQGKISRHDIVGKVGSGGPPLNVHTGSGHVRIQ